MTAIAELHPGARLYDRRLARQRQLHQVEVYSALEHGGLQNPRGACSQGALE
jgi:hypothetical protein